MMLRWIAALLIALLMAGCGTAKDNPAAREETEMKEIRLAVDGQEIQVQWMENEAVSALRERLAQGDVTVTLSPYGGFEQVGGLGFSLPRADEQTTTRAGDIVLYSGNQIVLFHGANSWAYTRLGHIEGMTDGEISALLGGQAVTITLSLG